MNSKSKIVVNRSRGFVEQKPEDVELATTQMPKEAVSNIKREDLTC